jgi:Ca2+-binding RTX toxin-like protein
MTSYVLPLPVAVAQATTLPANVKQGTNGKDTLTGSNIDNDYLYGQAGDDTFISGIGKNTFIGGDGIDLVAYYASTAAVTIDLSTSVAKGGYAEGDRIVGVENITGSAFNDKITGDFKDNLLSGGSGNDTLNGGGGSDKFIADAGNDSIDGGTGTDTALFSGNRADYTVTYHAPTQTYTITHNASLFGTDTIKNIENFQFDDGVFSRTNITNANTSTPLLAQNYTGTSGNDNIQGQDSRDIIKTGAGNDTLSGGGSYDYFEAGAGNDVILGGTGIDTAAVSGNFRDYQMSYNQATDTYTLTDLRSHTTDGIDSLNSVEYISFNSQVFDMQTAYQMLHI